MSRCVTRREALRYLIPGGLSAAVSAGPASASETESLAPSPDAVAMLYDTTKCIGCMACVHACAEANGLTPDARADGLHQAPMDLNEFTKNIIKLYQPSSGPSSFVKQQCMHCLDPFCVSACPFEALQKDPVTGVVGWEPSQCIGCRYCEVACPYHVPKFEWNAINPAIVKCEFCRHRLAKGQEPACTFVCPTHAVIFGHRSTLLGDAKDRIAESPGKYFENRVYGEKEAGGTQVLYLSHVPFEAIGLPPLSENEHPSWYTRWQKRVYKFFALPLLVYAFFAHKLRENFVEHAAEMRKEKEETGMYPQL
jgi:Fe-S-cluster-containing dehydrogenase component